MDVLEAIPFVRFLDLSTDELRRILAELGDPRSRRASPLDDDGIESLIRVMDRGGYRKVSALGPLAAKAWATRVGVRH